MPSGGIAYQTPGDQVGRSDRDGNVLPKGSSLGKRGEPPRVEEDLIKHARLQVRPCQAERLWSERDIRPGDIGSEG